MASSTGRTVRQVRWAMTVRCVTALVGGYAAASALVTLTARLLPIDPVAATGWAMVLSFLVFAILGLWCFHERRLGRVAGVVWGMAIGCGVLAYALGVRP